MVTELHAIDDRSGIAGARRSAVALADAVGLGEDAQGRTGLAVTEAASNIVKHAGRGRILLRELCRDCVGGVEILALDRGPGITDIGASLQDGRSTAGSPGNGL